ncbi:MAG: hypothetical protein MUE33_07945 [Cytophagaceae bacterium]|jgi:hypothetical protein|nr:hypothetical protein [Cytophagaceae bacterium]
MNIRHYRTSFELSEFDFPAINGLGESNIDYITESPKIVDNKIELIITKKFILIDIFNGKKNEVLTATSSYQIPIVDIKSKEYIYEFYKDAINGLNEGYEHAKKTLPVPEIKFPYLPIDNYENEFNRIFQLINSLN